MSPIEKYDPDTGRLTERRSHPLTPWASGTAVLMFGVLAYGFGGGYAGIGTVSRGEGTEGGSPSAPNAPTIDAIVFADTGDSLRLVTSAYSGDGTHDSTDFQVDTSGGDFTTPQYHDVSLGAVTTDTVAAIDSGAFVIARARHKDENGWSAWSDTVRVEMTAGVPTIFACEWERTSTGLTDAEQLCSSTWDRVSSANAAPAAEIVAADSGLTTRGAYFRRYNTSSLDSASSRQVHKDSLINLQEDHWGRVYMRSNNSTSRHNHTMNMGDNAGSWGFGDLPTSCTGTASLMLNLFEKSGDFGSLERHTISDVDNVNDEDCFTADAWYLIEWHVQFSSDTTFRVDVWVHESDSAGIITTENKWTTADFYDNDFPGTGPTADQRQLTDSAFSGVYNGTTLQQSRTYTLGNEGSGGSGAVWDDGYLDFASFAISVVGRLRDQEITTGTSR